MSLDLAKTRPKNVFNLPDVPEGWCLLVQVDPYRRVTDFLIYAGPTGYLVGSVSLSEARCWAGGPDFALAQVEEELREIFRWN